MLFHRQIKMQTISFGLEMEHESFSIKVDAFFLRISPFDYFFFVPNQNGYIQRVSFAFFYAVV